jgi:anaerobic magnesium-protoporphyrin IX monomethyl ester cyclase
MIDILICSLPSGVINRPPAAPAILKACAESAGFAARTEDLSLNFYIKQCNKNFDLYYEQSKKFEPYNQFDRTDQINRWVKDFCTLVREHNPKFVAFSVFSTFQHRACVLLCQELRKYFPAVKIILGGYGVPEPVDDTFLGFLSTDFKKFDQYMQFYRLVDHIIYGEGEQSIVDVLAGHALTSLPVDMNDVPVPNFDDYQLDKYIWHTVPVVTVTSSKGCVRSCTFCNVPRKFGSFRRKTGKNVAQELIELSQRYDITKFEFTDSLVNGSQRDFYEWIEIIADYNDQQPVDKKISWYGQYICRPQSQIPSGIYNKIKRSGAVNLIIGAESGSNAVLAAMQKKMTVQDIFEELDQFEQHGLQAQLLMMNGFHNETWERYLETLEFIVRCHRYVAAGVISKIAMGPPLMIEPEGYLHQHAEQLGIVINHRNTFDWSTVDDPTNTWLERVRRHVVAQVLLNEMGTSMTSNGIEELHLMLNQLKLYEDHPASVNS